MTSLNLETAFRIDVAGVDELERDFAEYPRRAQKVIVRAMNRGIDAANTVMVRVMARDTGLTQRDVRESMRLEHANFERPRAELAAKLKRIPLYAFKPSPNQPPSRGKGRGVSYLRRGVRVRVQEFFIARLSSGHLGVFARKGVSERKSRGAWSKNLPIEEKRGPSLGRVFRLHRAEGLARLQEAFETNLSHDLARALKQEPYSA